MRRIAHHDHRQQPERMKFLRIFFGCPEGARKWRILFLLCFCIAKKARMTSRSSWILAPADGKAGVILAAGIMSQKAKKSQQSTALQHGGIVDSNYKLNNMCDSEML